MKNTEPSIIQLIGKQTQLFIHLKEDRRPLRDILITNVSFCLSDLRSATTPFSTLRVARLSNSVMDHWGVWKICERKTLSCQRRSRKTFNSPTRQWLKFCRLATATIMWWSRLATTTTDLRWGTKITFYFLSILIIVSNVSGRHWSETRASILCLWSGLGIVQPRRFDGRFWAKMSTIAGRRRMYFP